MLVGVVDEMMMGVVVVVVASFLVEPFLVASCQVEPYQEGPSQVEPSFLEEEASYPEEPYQGEQSYQVASSPEVVEGEVVVVPSYHYCCLILVPFLVGVACQEAM